MDYRTTEQEVRQVSNDDVDWQIHYVTDTTSFKPQMCDVHTHGIDKHLGVELQMILNVGPQLTMFVLNNVGKLVLTGKKFQPGDRLFGLFQDEDMPIGFIKGRDKDGVDVLRVCLPDEHCNVFSNAEGIYGQQNQNPYL